jgi:uncharacterized protein
MDTDTTSLPVTVVIHRTVKVGREKEYEELLKGVLKEAQAFPGHMGVTVMRPREGSREYTLVFRFDTVDNLRHWEESPERAGWIQRLAPVTEGEVRLEKLTGMETWFALPGATVRPPPRYKMAMVSWLAAFPLVQLLTGVILPRLDFMPVFAKGFVMSVTMIVMMTYVVMPQLTKLLSSWLYPPA